LNRSNHPKNRNSSYVQHLQAKGYTRFATRQAIATKFALQWLPWLLDMHERVSTPITNKA
jgi:hypothetical protein